jgi:hypothetical protein
MDEILNDIEKFFKFFHDFSMILKKIMEKIWSWKIFFNDIDIKSKKKIRKYEAL